MPWVISTGTRSPAITATSRATFRVDSEILDVGSGTGWLAKHFPNYTGIDSHPEATEAARKQGRNVLPADVDEPLPFDDASFDGVVLKDVLEHVRDPSRVVREAQRVLRPRGRVFASSPDAQRWVWDDYTHRRPFTRKSFRLLFADQGFEVEQIGYESVMPGIGIVSRHTRRNRRPRTLGALAWLPFVPPERVADRPPTVSHRKPRVVVVRGHQANSWHLRPWTHLGDRFDVAMLETQGNWFDTSSLDVERVGVRTLRDFLPRGRLGDLAVARAGRPLPRPRRQASQAPTSSTPRISSSGTRCRRRSTRPSSATSSS